MTRVLKFENEDTKIVRETLEMVPYKSQNKSRNLWPAVTNLKTCKVGDSSPTVVYLSQRTYRCPGSSYLISFSLCRITQPIPYEFVITGEDQLSFLSRIDNMYHCLIQFSHSYLILAVNSIIFYHSYPLTIEGINKYLLYAD